MNDLRAPIDAGNTSDDSSSSLGSIKGDNFKHATERSERVAERMGRGAMTVAISEAFVILALIAVIITLINRPAEIFLVGETKGRFFQARGPVEDADVMKTLMEKFARRYVHQRETVNLVDDDERFSWVEKFSAKNVWSVFDQAMREGEYYKAAVRNHTTWSVKVLSAWQSNEANEGVWSLEIEKSHFWFNKRRGPKTQWIIELLLARDGRKKTEADNLENPAALYIAKYSAYEKESVVKGKKP
jgi:type IV secretory pathway component VirB8